MSEDTATQSSVTGGGSEPGDGAETGDGHEAGDGTDRLDALKSRKRLVQFISVGAVGTACDVTVLLVLVEVVGLLEELAFVAGFETAILVMFLINDRWTFAAEGESQRRSVLRRLGRSHAVRSAGFLTQFIVFVAVYRLLYTSLPVYGIDGWLLVAKGAGIVLGFTVNYVFESLFTWRVQDGC